MLINRKSCRAGRAQGYMVSGAGIHDEWRRDTWCLQQCGRWLFSGWGGNEECGSFEEFICQTTIFEIFNFFLSSCCSMIYMVSFYFYTLYVYDYSFLLSSFRCSFAISLAPLLFFHYIFFFILLIHWFIIFTSFFPFLHRLLQKHYNDNQILCIAIKRFLWTHIITDEYEMQLVTKFEITDW